MKKKTTAETGTTVPDTNDDAGDMTEADKIPGILVAMPVEDRNQFWTVEDCKRCLLAPHVRPALHPLPPDMGAIIKHIEYAAQLRRVKNALIVDDGVATGIRDILRAKGITVHMCDPLTGSIIPGLLVGELRARASSLKVRKESFKQLPVFDLVVTGCAQYQANGFVFSPHPHLQAAERGLSSHKRITSNAMKVVIAEPSQLVAETERGLNLMRAHTLATPAGLQELEWGRGTLPGPDEPAEEEQCGRAMQYMDGPRKAALLAEQFRLIEDCHGFDMAGALVGAISKRQSVATVERSAA